jgi:flavin-dependent dehydrogenase
MTDGAGPAGVLAALRAADLEQTVRAAHTLEPRFKVVRVPHRYWFKLHA